MQTLDEYLNKTESAMRKLFEGIDSYVNLLQQPLVPCLATSCSDPAALAVKFESWAEKNSEAIAASRQAQQKFVAESFALSTLCGAVLQVAYKAVELFSGNTAIPIDLSHIARTGTTATPFCCGRRIRNVPLGLVIYAGRNQHVHFGDGKLRELSQLVFDWLALNYGHGTESGPRDPAFDLTNPRLVSFAQNITALVGWRSYEAYVEDIRTLLQA